MLKVDEAVIDTDKIICRNISVLDVSERGLLSQNYFEDNVFVEKSEVNSVKQIIIQ